MKNVKNDTKYIIKRILIGVGIALILFNLKKCNVYAYSSVQTYQLSTNTVNATWLYSSSDISSCNKNANQFISFEYNDIKYNLCYSNSSPSREKTSGVIVFEYYNELYVAPGSYYGGFGTPDYINIVPDNNNYLSFILNKNDSPSSSMLYAPYLPNIFYNGDMFKNFVKLVPENIPVNSSQVLSKDEFVNNINDIQVVYNSLNIPVYFNTNTEIPVKPDNPLSNYTQLDLTGYEAVLLVPKNYQVMLDNFSHTEEIVPGSFTTYLDLDFYSQNCIRSSLINLSNVRDLITNNVGTSVGGLAGSISGTCTDEPFQTILSYRYDLYSGMIPMGIIVYNNEILTSSYNNGFGTSYVWYNPTYYDYYLIESLADFNSDITFTDFDGTEKTLNVEKIPDFQEMAKIAIETEEGDLNKQQINSLLNYTKIPIPFLQNLRNYQCEAIRMPFPWSNSIMIMPCMSTLYNNVIPSAMIGVISIIINGLLIYRGIMSIVGTFVDLSRPDSTKLEVLDL